MLTVRDVQAPVLQALVDAAEAAGARAFLADTVLSPRPTLWICGTPAQRRTILADLNARDVRLFGLKGHHRRHLDPRGASAASAVAYRKHVHDGVVIHGAGSGVEVEFCAHDPTTGLWRAARAGVESVAHDGYLRGLEETAFLGRRLPELGNARALRAEAAVPRRIDVVYTWVDGSDPAWRARKAEAEGGTTTALSGDATLSTRFESQDELILSLRSTVRYLVGLGSIFVVTDRQVPALPDDLRARVRIVDHAEIFPDPADLPTFNSHAIEAHLHRVPGLGEHYLYLNDDFLFGCAMGPSDFFDEMGRTKQFRSTAASLPHEAASAEGIASSLAGLNNRRLLRDRFGRFAFRKFKHAAYGIARSVMERMERDLPEAWAATQGNRFRSPGDHSIAGALYLHYAEIVGAAVPGDLRYGYYDTAHAPLREATAALLRDDWERPQMFCVNDSEPTHGSDMVKRELLALVRRVLPAEDGSVEPLPRPQSHVRRRYVVAGRKKLDL
ncbi:Stealth CR1 domain-containing protein [Jannaschia sp. Os4]|uniref:Stealth CR1 domain-containing protein n=1 Tax=Jannaschia sp. Os4 TaxID=2807617 RepID=UPI00193A5935|nr:Stealth CR1 domain-containing protein [Jannaschia sp. Os4]MBM2575456.1 Stealth CR1 domain-containing protein [Jannaschia sp. Os4]